MGALQSGFRPGDFARFEHLLEFAQIGLDLLARLLTEQARDRRAKLAARRRVVDLDAHLRAAVTWSRREAHAAEVLDLRAWQRAPGDQLVGAILCDLSVPLDASSSRAAHRPVGMPVVQHGHGVHMTHEAREVPEVAPELIHVMRLAANGDGLGKTEHTVGVFVAPRLARPPGREQVGHGYSPDRRDCHRQPVFAGTARDHRGAQQ